jgi:hypothetical protein
MHLPLLLCLRRQLRPDLHLVGAIVPERSLWHAGVGLLQRGLRLGALVQWVWSLHVASVRPARPRLSIISDLESSQV